MTWQDKFYKEFEDSLTKRKDINPIKFTEDIGYAIVGEYSNTYKRLMRVGVNSDYKPMYKFGVKSETTDGDYYPLFISASLILEEIENGRKLYILSYGKIKGIKPIDFTSRDDFYVNKKTGKLFEKKKKGYKEVSYLSLFERMSRAHQSKPTDVKALYLRTKIFFQRKAPSLVLTLFAYLSGFCVWVIEGKRYKYDVIERALDKEFGSSRAEKATQAPEEQIDFFGYKVSIWTLFSFSLIFIFVSILSQFYTIPFYDSIFINPSPMLVIAVAIISIVTYDKIIPIALKWVVKNFQIWAYNLKNRGVRLSI